MKLIFNVPQNNCSNEAKTGQNISYYKVQAQFTQIFGSMLSHTNRPASMIKGFLYMVSPLLQMETAGAWKDYYKIG